MLLSLISLATAHPLDGVWVLDASQEEVRATLDAATDAATSDFNFVVRPIARQILGRATNLCGQYAITVDEQFELACDDKKPLVRPASAERVRIQPADGSDPFDTALSVADASVTLELYGEHGERVNVYAAHGDVLTMKAEILSSFLDEPMTWTLAYRRQP